MLTSSGYISQYAVFKSLWRKDGWVHVQHPLVAKITWKTRVREEWIYIQQNVNRKLDGVIGEIDKSVLYCGLSVLTLSAPRLCMF